MEVNGKENGAFLNELCDCTSCPRNCHAGRHSGRLGFCQSHAGFAIGTICRHRGEEPVMGGWQGVCNVFFTRCNMQCIFCQNYQISRNQGDIVEYRLDLDEVVERIERVLDQGVKCLGFVSPSHCIPQMKAIIYALEERRRRPIYVMNSNGYDKKETLVSLEKIMDVYLPDFKYLDSKLAERYSSTADYPKVAMKALKEMFRQKGAHIRLDDEGIIQSGLIIRHLILPGQVQNSKECLRFIAHELSPSVYVSLMSQYHPTPMVAGHPELGRCLYPEEYEEVLEEFEKLGFHRGWTQDLESQGHYQPDFVCSHPFEHARGEI